MATYFFDTSALVKRYHDEDGTETVDEILDRDESEILISSLTVIESVSAFRRKHNRGELSESKLEQLIGVFFREVLDGFVIVPLDESLLYVSFALALDDDLRTLDSLQLSTGLSLARESNEDVTFVTADCDLADVARERHMDTLVPTS